MTENVFEAVLGNVSKKGKSAIKWDAFWHFFEWLLKEDEGHGLGESISISLLTHTLGLIDTKCIIEREYPVSGQKDGKGKWADLALGIPTLHEPDYLIVMDDIPYANSGSRRKLDNLNEYIALSVAYRPNAVIRAVAVTDAQPDSRLADAVYSLLKEEAADFTTQVGWKLLHLHTIATWVESAMIARQSTLTSKMRIILVDFVGWCKGQNRTKPIEGV